MDAFDLAIEARVTFICLSGHIFVMLMQGKSYALGKILHFLSSVN